MTHKDQRIEQARAAVERREWQPAHDALSAAERPLVPADLWQLAQVSYMRGRRDDFVRAATAAHNGFLENSAAREAARCAIWLGLYHANRHEMAQASGWFGRAARAVEKAGDCAERGFLLLPEGMRQLGAGDADAACEAARRAVEIGRRFGDANLIAFALHLHGRAKLRSGSVTEGLELLDEAMVSVLADELSPQLTGLIYCSVIGACREVWALDRAAEWTEALAVWCNRQPDLVAYTGECLVYRSEILRRRGAWSDAMDEAGRAAERFASGSEPDATGDASYQQAEVFRMRGEYAAAEASYINAGAHGREPMPGLALLRLAQGEGDTAAASIRRALAGEERPLRRGHLLPALIEIMLANGSPDAAEEACEELSRIADACGSATLAAVVATSRGAIALERGGADAALPHLRDAHERWMKLDAPYDLARVRVLLGNACRALDDPDGGMIQLRSARDIFEGLGAKPDVTRIDELLQASRARDTHGLTPRELEVLSLVATGLSNGEVAEQLSISPRTVERHVANIFGRLGVSSRAAATAYAWKNGLLDPPV